MAPRALNVLALAGLAALLAAVPPPTPAAVLPWTTLAETRDLAADEKNLWQEADAFDQALLRAGKVHADPALTAYLQGIMDRLYPEFKGRLNVRLIDAPHLNAFALPNGSVYVNTGLVARFQNEAQLATVLAHEGAHFTHRHALQQMEQVRSAAAFAVIVGLLGVPVVGDLVARSSMFGYSRELEREADQAGHARLSGVGYSLRESIRTFEHLQAEIRAADIREPFFFASHPRLQERIENFRALAGGADAGETGRERFVAQTAALRLAALASDLAAYRYKQVILVLEAPEQRQDYPPEAAYYLAEAYRLRAAPGDLERAADALEALLSQVPQFAPAYRALGLLCQRRGDPVRARTLLRRYLELAPGASDRAHVEHALAALPDAEPAVEEPRVRP